MLGKAELGRLIPHTGAMCLLDAILSWDEDAIRCSAGNLDRPDHPLAQNGRLPIVAGIEYAAQAMAAHGSLAGIAAPSRGGYLASLRDVTFNVEHLDDVKGPLIIDARRRLAGDAGAIYDFRLTSGDNIVLTGRAAVVLQAMVP